MQSRNGTGEQTNEYIYKYDTKTISISQLPDVVSQLKKVVVEFDDHDELSKAMSLFESNDDAKLIKEKSTLSLIGSQVEYAYEHYTYGGYSLIFISDFKNEIFILEAAEDLLPCPFCGEDAVVCKYDDVGHGAYAVECTKCECRIMCCEAKREDAIEKWNRRQNDTKQ